VDRSGSDIVETIARAAGSYWDELPKVVVAHATFQKSLSGDPSEAALAYPIQVYLGVKTPLKILAEEDHPSFKDAGKLGRPLQIDFVGIDKRSKWSWGLETKLFDGSKRDRVVRDIVKLLLLAEHKETANVGRYLLLLCPAKLAVKSNLVFSEDGRLAQHMVSATGQTPVNLFDVLLPWNLQEHVVFLDKIFPQLKTEFWRALRELKAESVRRSFKIKLIERDWSDDFVCGLWQVKLDRKDTISIGELSP
jgi:hypothetical protein